MSDEELIHATAIAIDGRAIMFTGPSGSGKSDLALRLIDRGAKLISDDQVTAKRADHGVILSAPETIVGKIELYSIGIVQMDHLKNIPLAMIAELTKNPERYPLDSRSTDILGRTFPVIRIDPFAASAPIKVELALKQAISDL